MSELAAPLAAGCSPASGVAGSGRLEQKYACCPSGVMKMSTSLADARGEGGGSRVRPPFALPAGHQDHRHAGHPLPGEIQFPAVGGEGGVELAFLGGNKIRGEECRGLPRPLLAQVGSLSARAGRGPPSRRVPRAARRWRRTFPAAPRPAAFGPDHWPGWHRRPVRAATGLPARNPPRRPAAAASSPSGRPAAAKPPPSAGFPPWPGFPAGSRLPAAESPPLPGRSDRFPGRPASGRSPPDCRRRRHAAGCPSGCLRAGPPRGQRAA